MKKTLVNFVIFFILVSCAKENVEEVVSSGFPVLSYNSEISETLTLDKNNIKIDPPREVNYWSQHFQNPRNDLNNIYTVSSLDKGSKIMPGKRGALNVVQPIYFENNVCHLLSNGYLECLNLEKNELFLSINLSKEEKKKYELIRGGLAYFDNKIVFVDAYGQVKLIDLLDQSVNWTKNIDIPILSPPLIYRDYIYFITADNRIYALNILDGSVEWSFQTIAEAKKNLFTASLVAKENFVIAPFSNGELIAFIYDTGRPIWSENLSKISVLSNFDIKDISASPVISGNSIYSLSSNGKLVSLNAINGQRNWAIDLSGYRTPIISGNVLYVIDDNGKLICIDQESGEIYWITNLEKFRKGQKVQNLNLWLGPYMINNLLYSFSYFGEVKVVSPLSGEVLSTNSLKIENIIIPPLILSNSVIIADEKSNVYRYN